MGPVIAGLVLWAASVTYTDRLLAGFIYALALILFLLAASTDWLDGYLARKLERGDAARRSARSLRGQSADHRACWSRSPTRRCR